MVAAGLGIAIVPKNMEVFKMSSVVYRELTKNSGFTVPLNVAYRKHAETEMLRRFMKVCKDVRDASRNPFP